jgi:hypothetical protein
MKKESPKFRITREDLLKMKEIDVRTIDPSELADIEDVKINTELPYEERLHDYIRQIKNPYCYRCRGMVIKISFSGQRTMEECLKAAMYAEKEN